MRIFFLLLALPAAITVSAQAVPHLFEPATKTRTQRPDSLAAAGPSQDSIRPGHVQVFESPRIKTLMSDYAAKKQPLMGYRVQIFLGDRATAETTRRNFLLQHPDLSAYLSYLAPNFRVRVGDLRDRVAAEFLRGKLQAEYPGLYIVPDEIEPPRLPVAPK